MRNESQTALAGLRRKCRAPGERMRTRSSSAPDRGLRAGEVQNRLTLSFSLSLCPSFGKFEKAVTLGCAGASRYWTQGSKQLVQECWFGFVCGVKLGCSGRAPLKNRGKCKSDARRMRAVGLPTFWLFGVELSSTSCCCFLYNGAAKWLSAAQLRVESCRASRLLLMLSSCYLHLASVRSKLRCGWCSRTSSF